MIERIRGKIIEKGTAKVLVDVGGIGFALNISVNTATEIGDKGSEVDLYTYLQVREDAMVLFGFAKEVERDLFLLLISVSKIGPKTALSALSGMTVENFVRAVRAENAGLLTKIPGIGKQSAERIIVELKGKMAKFESSVAYGPASSIPPGGSKKADEAIRALESLGYKRFFAEKAVAKVFEEKGTELAVEDIIKAALKYV